MAIDLMPFMLAYWRTSLTCRRPLQLACALILTSSAIACGDEIIVMPARPAQPVAIVPIMGDGQSTPVDRSFPLPLVLKVYEEGGVGTPGVVVVLEGHHIATDGRWLRALVTQADGSILFSIPSASDPGPLEILARVAVDDAVSTRVTAEYLPGEETQPPLVWVEDQVQLALSTNLGPYRPSSHRGFRDLSLEGDLLHGFLEYGYATMPSVLCFDLVDPADPRLAWNSAALDVDASSMSGGRVFAWNTQRRELSIHDISAHGQITSLSTSTSPDFKRSYYEEVLPNPPALYLASSNGSVESVTVVDISDPTNPIWPTGEASTGDRTTGLDLWGSLLFQHLASAGLQLMDVSDPLAPQLLSRFGTFGTASATQLSGNTLWVINRDPTSIASFDLADPTEPRFLGIRSLPSYDYAYHGAFVIDGQLGYVGSYDGVHVLDLQDPVDPTYLGTVIPKVEVSGIELVGGRLIVTGNGGLYSLSLGFADPVATAH